MSAAIVTRDLVKCYGARRALDGLTLEVPRFALLGLVGANGAGKTTWMMTVAGFTRPTSGTVDLLGSGPFDAAVHRGRLSILPQDSSLPLESRAHELLVHYGRLQGLDRAEAARSAADMLRETHLGDRLNAPIRTLSHGMRKRVMIAQCFIGHPEVVLLDEPLSGLDPREVAHMRDFLLRRRGRQTIVISSHNLSDIERVCDRVAFIEKGRTLRVARLEEVTGSTSRLAYALARPLQDLAPLRDALPEATLTLSADGLSLACRFDPRRATPDAVNRALLPLLLAPACGVLAVTQGESLEAGYLRGEALRPPDPSDNR